MRNVLRLALAGITILFVVGVILAGITQTQFFRDRLRSVVLTELDSLFEADIQMGPITGNLVTGFSIDSIAFVVDNRSIIGVRRVDFRYNLFGIPGRTISVSSLTLVQPEIHIHRATDGTWNLARLLRQSPPDTTPSKPFLWSVVVKRFEIRDGLLDFVDSVAIRDCPPGDTLTEHRHDFVARGINVLLAARIAPEEKYVVIDRLQGMGIARNIDLLNLTGEITATPDSVSIRNLSIITGKSSLHLSASMQRVDLLKGIVLQDLDRRPTAVSLEAGPVDFNELQQIVPGVDFLVGEATLGLEASGEFGRLTIHRLDLTTRHTRMRWKGTIRNLHRPADLALSVHLTDGVIDPGDVVDLMPSFHLPDLRSLGPVSLALEFDGRPLDFHTKFDLSTSAGTVRSSVALVIGGPAVLRYNGDVSGEGVDLGKLFADPRLRGSLNTTAHIEGEGVSLDRLASTFQLDLGKSEFRGLVIPPSHLMIDAHRSVVSVNGSLALGEMMSTVSATLDRRSRTTPTFSVDASLHHLNIASIAHDDSLDSDITLSLQARGHGLTWSSLGGEALVDLSTSRYRGYRLATGDIHILLDQSLPAAKRLTITSPVADVSLAGAFNLETLTRTVKFEIQNLRNAVAEKFRFLDSTLTPGVDNATVQAVGRSLGEDPDTTNAHYTLTFKDLEPVSAVAGETPFRGEGVITGTVRGTFADMALDGTMDAKYFFYGNVENGFLLQNAHVGFALEHLQPENPLHVASVHLRANAEKMNALHAMFDSLIAEISYGHEFARYGARAVWNGKSRTAIGGTASVSDSGIRAHFDSLSFAYKDFTWIADSTANFSLTADKASLSGLVLRHDTSTVGLAGTLGNGGVLRADLLCKGLNLADLRYLLETDDQRPEENLFQGGASLHLLCDGTLSSPRLSAVVRAEGIAFKRIPFGKLAADFQYADTSLHVSLFGGTLGGTETVDSAITIRGTLPLNLAFTSVSERLPDRPMDLTILSRGMQISILDPLLPTFDELSGLLRCKVTIGGSPLHPEYAGSMTLDRCQFLFVPNNIRYSLNAILQPSGEKIRVVDAEIRNVGTDDRGGRKGELHVKGDLSFRNFRPGDFNLVGNGSLLVVKETSRLSSLSLYGNLFMETGQGGLRFTGDIENSLLRGAIIISNSNLVFPPTETNVHEESQLSIPLTFVDDTTKVHPTVSRTALTEFFGEGDGMQRTPGSTENIATKSFLDGVRYDLDVETVGGDTQIKMIFNAITNEELVANIEGRLNITGDGTQWLGDLTVSRAYYNFFRRFDAEGTLRFHGNMMNPELDLTATYQGQRADTSGRATENIVATFKITGTRLEPKVDISMTINGEDYYSYKGPKSNDVKNDAIEFILYGNFPLSSSQRASASADIGSTVSSSLVTGATSLLTGALSEFLRSETGIINSVEFSYGAKGSLGESADIRLSGVAWNGLWHYGGKILDNPLNNANFSILYSLGTIFNRPSLRNLMVELERKVELNTLSPTNDLKAVNSARLFYRFSF